MEQEIAHVAVCTHSRVTSEVLDAVWMQRRKFCHDFAGAVVRSIIPDKDVEFGIYVLFNRTAHALLYPFAVVECGDTYREGGLGHVRQAKGSMGAGPGDRHACSMASNSRHATT